jgi:hypothetical protein
MQFNASGGGDDYSELAVSSPSRNCTVEEVRVLTLDVVDGVRDFILDQPVWEENFCVKFRGYESIPTALDIKTVQIRADRENYYFSIAMAKEGLSDILRRQPNSLQIGVYVDKDRNGVSDLILTTTGDGESALALTSNLEPLERSALKIESNSATFSVPRYLLGDQFDWVAFTGYTPIEGAYFRTPVDNLFFVPVIDIAYPNEYRLIDILTSYSGSGQGCQVTSSQYTTCPNQGTPSPVPGLSYQGVLIYGKNCAGIGYELWCLTNSFSFFGKRVFKGSVQGWVGKCPFTCGYNTENAWDTDGDGVIDRLIHSVQDKDCGSHHDQDNDGLLDVMRHDYTYSSNSLVSCNREYDYTSGSLLIEKCCPARLPFSDPINVPGSIDQNVATGQLNCPP